MECVVELQQAEVDQIRSCQISSLMCVLSMSLQLVETRGYHVEGAEVDAQSCMDQSILAIFENSTVPSEVRTKAKPRRSG